MQICDSMSSKTRHTGIREQVTVCFQKQVVFVTLSIRLNASGISADIWSVTLHWPNNFGRYLNRVAKRYVNFKYNIQLRILRFSCISYIHAWNMKHIPIGTFCNVVLIKPCHFFVQKFLITSLGIYSFLISKKCCCWQHYIIVPYSLSLLFSLKTCNKLNSKINDEGNYKILMH